MPKVSGSGILNRQSSSFRFLDPDTWKNIHESLFSSRTHSTHDCLCVPGTVLGSRDVTTQENKVSTCSYHWRCLWVMKYMKEKRIIPCIHLWHNWGEAGSVCWQWLWGAVLVWVSGEVFSREKTFEWRLSDRIEPSCFLCLPFSPFPHSPHPKFLWTNSGLPRIT